jgi:O-antigen/teichoic acid export membrane protein
MKQRIGLLIRSSGQFVGAEALENTGSGLWHKPLRNAGKLGMGRGFQAVCSLAYLGVAARCMGTEGFGALVLIHSLCPAVAQLARFQSWRFTIRFGTPALGKSSTVELHRVLNFGFALDLIGVLVGVGIYAAGFSTLARLIHLPEPVRGFALIYGVLAVTLINFGGSAMGVLRLLDRFTALAWQSTLEPLVRLGGSLLVLSLGGSLRDFLIAGWWPC